MPKYRIELVRSVQKDVHKLDVQIARRIEKKLNYFVASKKPLSFAEALSKPGDADYRWRVGDYRILFDVKDGLITIVRIQHRREVYRKK